MGPKKEHDGQYLSAYAPAVLSPKKPWSGLICGIPPRKQRRDVWSERVDSRRQPRQLARDRVLVEHALGYRPMQLGLRQPEGRAAVALSPVAIAASTFFTKVRTRLTLARSMAVRLAVCRMRFSADL